MHNKYWFVALALMWSTGLTDSPSTVWGQSGESHAEVASDAELHGDVEHGDATAEHGAAASGNTNPVTWDPDLAIVTAIIFLLLLAVLWKFAWGPMITALDKREQMVADQLAEAKQNQEQARRLLADHEERLAGTAAEVKQMLDQARRDAESQKQQIVESAQAAAAAEKDRAVREINAAKNAALQDLAAKSVDTAVNLAGQIVARQLTPEDHSRLVGDALQQFSHES